MRQDDDHPEEEVALAGGNMSAVVLRGGAVHRTAGPWTPTIHRFLEHLLARGITWLPRPLGLDEQGREVLTFLPGTVPAYPMPSWVWHESVLDDAAERLARVHDAGRDFDRSGAVWQLPSHQPSEVICLNDVAPYNMVFDDDHGLSGMIDVDVASPGPRGWDLAYLAYRLVPLTVADDTGTATRTMSERRSRLDRLCRAYSQAARVTVHPRAVLEVLVPRLLELADFTARRADEGAHHVAAHVEGYRSDARWVEEHAGALG